MLHCALARENFMNNNNYTFNVLLDSDGQVGSQYNITGIPTYIIISKEGYTVYRKHSAPDAATIEKYLP